jgi:hypothetical protein
MNLSLGFLFFGFAVSGLVVLAFCLLLDCSFFHLFYE